MYNFATVRRAREAAFSSWKTKFYNHDDSSAVLYCPIAHISLYNDKYTFELDPYFNLDCYWIMVGGRHHMLLDGREFEEKEHWFFPSMALKSNPTTLFNEHIRHAISSDKKAQLTHNIATVGNSSVSFKGICSLISLR